MISKFLALEQEKQQRILNAAMEEFAKKGYKAASTNQIVAKAGISKGILFHYFTNKKELFFYLYDYCIDVILDDFFGKIDLNQRDILLRLRNMLVVKLELMKKYPVIIDFLIVANEEESVEIKGDLALRNRAIIQESYQKMFTSIDESLFRPDIDAQKGKQIIIWTIEGISSHIQARQKGKKVNELQNKEVLDELDAYLHILRNALYS